MSLKGPTPDSKAVAQDRLRNRVIHCTLLLKISHISQFFLQSEVVNSICARQLSLSYSITPIYFTLATKTSCDKIQFFREKKFYGIIISLIVK